MQAALRQDLRLFGCQAGGRVQHPRIMRPLEGRRGQIRLQRQQRGLPQGLPLPARRAQPSHLAPSPAMLSTVTPASACQGMYASTPVCVSCGLLRQTQHCSALRAARRRCRAMLQGDGASRGMPTWKACSSSFCCTRALMVADRCMSYTCMAEPCRQYTLRPESPTAAPCSRLV